MASSGNSVVPTATSRGGRQQVKLLMAFPTTRSSVADAKIRPTPVREAAAHVVPPGVPIGFNVDVSAHEKEALDSAATQGTGMWDASVGQHEAGPRACVRSLGSALEGVVVPHGLQLLGEVAREEQRVRARERLEEGRGLCRANVDGGRSRTPLLQKLKHRDGACRRISYTALGWPASAQLVRAP
jgi:hypothetical protein